MKGDIIIVDDDTEEMEILREALEATGCKNIRCLEGPFEMMKHMQTLDRNALPALIVTDYNMPKLNGFNLVSFIKHHKDYKLIKLAILSESMLEKDKPSLLSAGVSKIYSKPSTLSGYKTLAEEIVELAKG